MTSIPDPQSKPAVIGGKYYMATPEEYEKFLQFYTNCHLIPNRPAGFTEKQHITEGPLVVDVDFRYRMDIVNRVFTPTHVDQIMQAYLDVLPELFQFDNDTEFNVYYLQRPHTTTDLHGNQTKDGMHFMFGFHINQEDSLELRKRVMPVVTQLCQELPLTNTPDDVIDLGIASKTTSWQVYGSRKPGNTPYLLHRIFKIRWSASTETLVSEEIPEPDFCPYLLKRVRILSVRNLNIPFYMHTAQWTETLQSRESDISESQEQSAAKRARLENRSDGSVFECMANSQLVFILQSHEILQEYIKSLLERWEESQKYALCDLYKYVMALSSDYYGPGSFVKWLNVGWALKVTNEQLFVVWVAFSAQSPTFRFEDVADMLARWNAAKNTGYTSASIKYWLNEENPEKYKEIHTKSANSRIRALITSGGSVDPCGDVDQARLLFDLYGDFHVCVSIRKNAWFSFKNHRWEIDEEGSQLRSKIDIIHSKFLEYEIELKLKQTAIGVTANAMLNPKDKNPEYEKLQKTIDGIQRAAKKLNETGKRKNIMVECKELFYHRKFMDKLDVNPMLFCCKNGVVDLEQKRLRPGRPDDYISISCNNNYLPELLNESTNPLVADIRSFFSNIYPIEDTREYVWDHLASVLFGDACQTFHIYWGGGSNGKTKIMELMTMAMGEYGHTVPISAICDERAKVGSVSPEIVELRGIRWGTMFEPSQRTTVEEGPFKQITGGDPLTGRHLWVGETVTFKPQVTIVVCSNYDLQFRTTDHGTWRRVRKIPHIALFTEEAPDGSKPYQVKADLDISAKFKDWVDTFVSLLVQRAFRTGGKVEFRQTIRQATVKMRQGQDMISEFVGSRIAVELPLAGGFGVTKAQITAEYTNWFKENYGGVVRKTDITNLHEHITQQFGEFCTATSAWRGIRLIRPSDPELDINQFYSSAAESETESSSRK
jgi:phage/plasmid-associated DNA primase